MNEPLDLSNTSAGGGKKEEVNNSIPANPSGKKPEGVFAEPKRLEVMVDVDEKPKDKPTTFDFMDNSTIEDTIANPTKGDETKKSQAPPKNQDDLLSKLSSTSSSSSSSTNLDDGDFAENADFIIDGLCFLLTAGFRWYSMDTTDTPYEFKEAKINKLKSQLARILKRKQKAFPAEWAFVGTLLACCITPATKANDNRKKVKEERAIEESRKEKLKEEGKGEESPRKGRGRGQPSK